MLLSKILIFIFQNDVKVIKVVFNSLLKILGYDCLNEGALATKLNMLANSVGIEDVSDFNVAILKVSNDIRAGDLDFGHIITPVYLFVFKIIYTTQVKVETLVVTSYYECLQEFIKNRSCNI
jgi:hypothetical protein